MLIVVEKPFFVPLKSTKFDDSFEGFDTSSKLHLRPAKSPQILTSSYYDGFAGFAAPKWTQSFIVRGFWRGFPWILNPLESDFCNSRSWTQMLFVVEKPFFVPLKSTKFDDSFEGFDTSSKFHLRPTKSPQILTSSYSDGFAGFAAAKWTQSLSVRGFRRGFPWILNPLESDFWNSRS